MPGAGEGRAPALFMPNSSSCYYYTTYSEYRPLDHAFPEGGGISMSAGSDWPMTNGKSLRYFSTNDVSRKGSPILSLRLGGSAGEIHVLSELMESCWFESR